MVLRYFGYFVVFAVLFFCVECLCRGFYEYLATKNLRLKCFASAWMLPIYGFLLFIVLFVRWLFPETSLWLKGFVYMALIFVWEYLSGYLLRTLTGVAPWDYAKKTEDGMGSPKKYNIDGLIAFDYAPLWYLGGILAELLYLFLKTYLVL